MDARAVLFLIILPTFWCCDDATRMMGGSTASLSSSPQKWEMKDEMVSDKGWCTFCKLVIAPVLDSLSNNTNQEEALNIFHLICHMTIIVKAECNNVVDYYIPLFFNETSRMTPRKMCTKVGLCCNQTDHHRILSTSDQQMQIVHQKLPEMIIENVSDPCFLQGCKRIFLDNAVFIQTRFSKRNILSYAEGSLIRH